MKQTILLFAFFVLSCATASAQSIVGQWKTIDDETGKAKSIVEIYEKNGKYYGKIVKLLNRGADEDPDPVCDKCEESDDRYKKKVIGMEILRDLEKDGDEWSDGKILDPKKGKVYDCEVWLKGGNLRLKGCIFWPACRTQTWYKVE